MPYSKISTDEQKINEKTGIKMLFIFKRKLAGLPPQPSIIPRLSLARVGKGMEET